MAEPKLVSIIIDNYNYEKYVSEAINSALAQTYKNKEIIVVDDGSTDKSRDIIESYGSSVIPVYKENGGQASAFNAGYKKSKGDIVIFLDSDDTLFENAVENIVELFDPSVSKVHWPLWIVTEDGTKTGETKPGSILPEGDFKQTILSCGPTSYISSPTSGNAWSRTFMEKVCPLPEDVPYYKKCADEYLYTLAPVFGMIKSIQEPQGCYRIHGKNIYSALSPAEKLELELSGHEQQTVALGKTLKANGFKIDADEWRKNSWFHILKDAIQIVDDSIPDDKLFILIDDNTWNAPDSFSKKKWLPFIERNGIYFGQPSSDEVAIAELNRMIPLGSEYLVIARPSFWWMEYYKGFAKYLNDTYVSLVDNETVRIYDLKKSQ